MEDWTHHLSRGMTNPADSNVRVYMTPIFFSEGIHGIESPTRQEAFPHMYICGHSTSYCRRYIVRMVKKTKQMPHCSIVAVEGVMRVVTQTIHISVINETKYKALFKKGFGFHGRYCTN